MLAHMQGKFVVLFFLEGLVIKGLVGLFHFLRVGREQKIHE